MVGKIRFLSVFCAVPGFFCASVYGADLFSQYGQIQNVPGYSLNPANRYGTAYNQKFPQPIYANGPELTSSECIQTVSALVASYCSGINYCSGVGLSDVRPALMVQLSRMSGHNYASACGGYIDAAFNDYVKNYSGTANMNRFVAFPDAIGGTISQPTTNAKIENSELPKWQQEYNEREQELQNLQSQNNVQGEDVAEVDFPKTFDDLSLDERNAILAQGYEPYKDNSAYVQLNIVGYEKKPVEKKHVEEKTVEETPVEETSVEETPVEETPVEETSVEEIDTGEVYRNIGVFVWDLGKGDLASIVDDNNNIVLNKLPKDYWWNKNCSDHYVKTNISDGAPINKAGNKVFGDVSGSDYFIDFPKTHSTKLFPGLILLDPTSTWGEIGWYVIGGAIHWGSNREYEVALMAGTISELKTKFNNFVTSVKSADTTSKSCQNLTAYLVQVDDKKKPKNVRILPDIEGIDLR